MLGCSGGLKKLSGEDRIFLDPEFWEEAEAMFGKYGGGWWLRDKTVLVRYEGGNWYVTEGYHYQLVVLDADRMEDYADVTIPLGQHGRLVSLKARTIKSTGEIIPVDKSKVYERSLVPGYMLFADLESKVFAMPGLSDRCILDYSWQVETEALYFHDLFRFGSALPTRKAKYTYSLDGRLQRAGYRLHYLNNNVALRPDATTQVTPYGEMSVYSWTLENIEAYPIEPWSPPRDLYMPIVYLAGFAPDEQSSDWSVLAKWYTKLVPWLNEYVPEVKEIAEATIGEATDIDEILHRAMDYVGNNIRYVAVKVEESGYKPHYPGDVIKNQYGDCKDMACLVVSLLRHKGIKAYPALLLTRSEGKVSKALVMPRFNHMIVLVSTDQGDIWLDPTAAPCPIGYLPSEDRGVDALVIDGKQAYWKHIPEESVFPCLGLTKSELLLNSSGDCQGSGTVTLCGDLAFEFASAVRGADPTHRARVAEERIRSYFGDVTFDSCAIVNVDEQQVRVCLSTLFSKSGAVIRIDDKLAFKPEVFRGLSSSLAGLPLAAGRTFPLWFPTCLEERDTIRIEAPAGWIAEKVPMGVNMDTDFASYRITTEARGRIVEIVIHSRQKAGQVPSVRIGDFVEFWSRARDLIRREIVFKRA